MHRIDTSTAKVDKFGVGKNGFTAGNPQTGELPTALDQDYFDSIQEEIAAVIEGAAIALVKGNRSQLLTAMKKLFLQPGNNLSEIVDTAVALNKLGGAPLASPTFTGTPKGPTATAGTNTTQLATTAFVQALIAGFLKTSNNLLEIATAGAAAQLAARSNISVYSRSEVDGKVLGVGQSWIGFTSAQRQNNVNYTNDTVRPIMVSVSSGTAAVSRMIVDGVTASNVLVTGASGGNLLIGSLVIPAGSVYQFNSPTSAVAWAELR